jgi:hypothetical protein
MFIGRWQLGKHSLARGSKCRQPSGFAEAVVLSSKETNNRGDK